MKRRKQKIVKNKLQLVWIIWIDAESEAEWKDLEAVKTWADKGMHVDSVGWIVDDNAQVIVMASEIARDGGIGNKTKIPKSCILSTKLIRMKHEHKASNG